MSLAASLRNANKALREHPERELFTLDCEGSTECSWFTHEDRGHVRERIRRHFQYGTYDPTVSFRQLDAETILVRPKEPDAEHQGGSDG